VVALRGRVVEEYTLARLGAERLWHLLATEDYVSALGALTGNQAVQMVKAGLKAIYLSGWQVAADANLAGQTYPDQSLYPANSVPAVVRRINNALLRADQISWTEDSAAPDPHFLAPIVADAEAGFGGPLNAFELMRAMIAAGAAGVHWEDQLASEKKCGHMGGKVLVPTVQHIRTLNAARLAADICDVPTLIVARTDSLAANLLTSDHDERDARFVTGDRTAEGFYRITRFQKELGSMGYAFQFITLAGFHALNHSMFELARGYARDGMSAYVRLQQAEFAAATHGYTAVKHQAEVGTGYFDMVASALNPRSDTLALAGSTESEQF
jgi:isocitrate lyase